MNEEIIAEIDLLKGRVKTFRTLTEIVNKKFKTNFLVSQVQYQVNKLLEKTYGNPQEDAFLFIELAKAEAKNDGFFEFKTDTESKFTWALFLTKTMILYSKYFLDIIIVDATYKRNRFNLPVINIIGVNHFGQNIMLAFGLLSNETTESYVWLFSELKKAWSSQNPLNFILDGCEAMKQGSFYF